MPFEIPVLKINSHWQIQDATVSGFEDTSPPVNSKQLGVCDLGTEFGLVSIQFFPVLLRTNGCLITEKSSLTPGSIYITNLATLVLYMSFLEGTEQQHQSHPQLMFLFLI